MPIIEVKTEAELQEQLTAAAGKPTVLAFTSEDCPPCAADKPNLEAVAAAHPEATVIRVDVDKSPELADKYDAGATPTYLVASDGSKCSRRSRACKEVEWAADVAEALKVKVHDGDKKP